MPDTSAPEPLIDPDCRDGKCGSCVGGPCEHDCHHTAPVTADDIECESCDICGAHPCRGGCWTGEFCGEQRHRCVDEDACQAAFNAGPARFDRPDRAPVTADDLRDRITAIFTDWESARWEEDLPNTDQITSATDAVMAEVMPELAKAREERDQAIAHDRQPYPTADAYERACKALWHHRERADKAEAERDAAQKALAAYAEKGAWIEADRDALKASVENALAVYREHRQTQLTHPDCHACAIGMALSRDMPRTPDSREDIQSRLAALDTPDTTPKAGGQ